MILDSGHDANLVSHELENLTPILKSGDYPVVEETIVNGHLVRPDFGPAPWEAVARFREVYPKRLVPDLGREAKFGCTASAGGFFKPR